MAHHYSDFLEENIATALEDAGIPFTYGQRLDFYLPDFNIYIEIKQYHSERVNDQLASQENVILLQGKSSVDFFINTLKNKA